MKRSLIISLVAGILLSLATLPLQAQLIRKATTPGQYVDQVTSLFAQHRWDKGKDLLELSAEDRSHEGLFMSF